MSIRNGQSIVLGNGSAVVDDFELIRHTVDVLKPARKPTKLDDITQSLRLARRSLTALEVIRVTCGGQGDAESAIDYLSKRVTDSAIRSIHQISAERCA